MQGGEEERAQAKGTRERMRGMGRGEGRKREKESERRVMDSSYHILNVYHVAGPLTSATWFDAYTPIFIPVALMGKLRFRDVM